MIQKQALAILGSPHSGGITATMLKHSVNVAEKAGYAVTKINLYEKNLAYLREKIGEIQICELDGDAFFSEEELQDMRKVAGVVLSLPFGKVHGAFASYLMEQLKVQDCALCGVAIRDADERFLRRYYGRTFFARGNGGEM